MVSKIIKIIYIRIYFSRSSPVSANIFFVLYINKPTSTLQSRLGKSFLRKTLRKCSTFLVYFNKLIWIRKLRGSCSKLFFYGDMFLIYKLNGSSWLLDWIRVIQCFIADVSPNVTRGIFSALINSLLRNIIKY